MHIRRIASAIAACTLAATVSAHEFWLRPSDFNPQPGAIVGLHLELGDFDAGERYTRNPAHVREFVAFAPGDDAAHPIPGRPGSDPAGMVRVNSPGLYLAGYLSNPTTATIEAAIFNPYLEEKGLRHVITRRADTALTGAPATERFSRAAKTIFAVGDPRATDASGFDRRIGFPVELVPEANPLTLAPDQALPILLLVDGEPTADAQVTAWPAARPEDRITLRTDQHGRVSFALPADGAWLIETVHMTELANDPEAQWASIWASLTFELPARATPVTGE